MAKKGMKRPNGNISTESNKKHNKAKNPVQEIPETK